MIARLLFSVSILLGVMPATAASSTPVEPYPLEYFALRAHVNNVVVSPDGKHLALLKIPTRDGNPVLEVYETADLSAEPFRMDADPMEITNFYWASDRDIVFSARQKVRDKIEGFNQGVYEGKIARLDIRRKESQDYKKDGGQRAGTIENVLPGKPNKVIVSYLPGTEERVSLKEAFRPRAYYEYDLRRGTRKLILRAKLDVATVIFDGAGHPIAGVGFDIHGKDFVWYYREKGAKGWTEMHRLSEDSHEDFLVQGYDDNKPGNLLVVAHNGHDKAGLWSFNPKTREFDELIYRRSDVDVVGVRSHSKFWEQPDKIVAVAYAKDKVHYEYFDPEEGALYEQLEVLVPYAHSVTITSRSRDGGTFIVRNTGPRDPGTFYLYRNGEFKTVGSRQPLLESEKLADVRYITFDARDGRKIPAYVTIPHGEPPFPTVVLPHGGPFVQEVVGYDEWGQLLANNGYLVVQPQYRGSQGYGLEHYLAAFMDGSEAGFKMQDDKDDAALHLVREGLADPDRLAMFGWSYGGYAALAAASRTPQIYQCTIAGAAVADMTMQVNYYRWLLRGAAKEQQLKYRDGALNPVDEVDNVNVPMLLIHGDVDQRVPPEHMRKYLKALEDTDHQYRAVWLEGADHFSNTLFYNHQITLYENLIGYLNNECGSDGLKAD